MNDRKIDAAGVGILSGLFLALGAAVGFWRGDSEATRIIQDQFISGKATVITYTVPGAGLCRAVLVDGQRHAETCEGGEK